RHAAPFLAALLGELQADAPAWHMTPAVLVEQGRVAIGDDIGERLGARMVMVLIGERPGLSSPDSMGIYLTWAPRRGRSDAERNCISNVRPEGQDCPEAARRAAWLLRAARAGERTGVALKDESAPLRRIEQDEASDFTLARRE
ncbi:MAG: ethanolamine ammonia-lyase light chain EutC, partial [Comamonas sp.]